MLAPHCIIEIGSRRFDSWDKSCLITDASVELSTDKSGEGVVSLLDPDFKIVDAFGANKLQARFWLGWEKELGNSLFIGNSARNEWQGNISTFRFHDNSQKMKQTTKSRYHNKKTDLQILKTLAEENELTFIPPDSAEDSDVYDSLIQRGTTDWEFAKEICSRAGWKIYVRDDALFVKEFAVSSQSVAVLKFREDFELLRGFNLSYKFPESKKGRLRKVEVRGRGRGGKRLSGTNQTGERGVDEVVINKDLAKHTVKAAKRQAKGKTGRRREYAFEHSIQTLPSFQTRIEVSDTVTLKGMGEFYSGNYIVTEIRYEFKAGRLIEVIQVGSDLKK